jgi:hypothetical protein
VKEEEPQPEEKVSLKSKVNELRASMLAKREQAAADSNSAEEQTSDDSSSDSDSVLSGK